MSANPIRVGILGAQPGRSWAARAHIPALRSLPADFEIVAVANTTLRSAEVAARELDIPLAFAGVDALANCADVDLVAVTVKVPFHFQAVSTLLAAGKHIYCEWPLGNGLREAEELAALAAKSDRTCVVGIQARAAAELAFVRDLVADGYIGHTLSTTISGTCLNWSGVVDQANAYTQDPANGASMLAIPFAHTMAAVSSVLGDVAQLSALLSTRRETTQVRETGEVIPMGVPDQILISGELTSGAPISVHYRGDVPRGDGFSWVISGTRGTLEITGSGGNAQFMALAVSGAQDDHLTLDPLPLPGRYRPDQDVGFLAQNVRAMYRMMSDDIRTRGHTAPTFQDAVHLHRLLDAIETSAQSGQRIHVNY